MNTNTNTGATLTRSKDRKVTNAVSPNGKTALIANAFGLPAGKAYACPGATAFCETICYAGKLEKVYKNVSKVLVRNFDLLKGSTRQEMITLLGSMIREFVADCEKRGAEKIFRIHWDGDFFNPTYVTAWHKVITEFPDVQFWAYTRVATAAVYLHKQRLGNLALYFSGDRDNIAVARHMATLGINVAYVGRTFADGNAEFPGATRCPENNGAIPLISSKGSACARCGLCVKGRKPVLFSATKK